MTLLIKSVSAVYQKGIKMLAVPLNAFGCGIHPVGLVTMPRCFENGALERIGVMMYTGVAYDTGNAR